MALCRALRELLRLLDDPNARRYSTQQFVTDRARCLRDMLDGIALTPQDDTRSGVSIIDAGEIDAQHVHRHATHRARQTIAHQHGRSSRRVTRIAIGITARHDADAHRALGTKYAAIAYGIARRELACCDELARERHRRLQTELASDGF